MMEDEQLTAAEIWERLKDTYQKSDNGTNGKLWTDLVRLHIPKDATYEEVQKTEDTFLRLCNKIRNTKILLPDILPVLALRLNFTKYQAIVDVLALQANITPEKAIEACLNTARRNKDDLESDTTTKVIVGRTKGRNSKPKSDKKKS